MLFSKIGAFIVFFCMAIVLALSMFNLTISSVASKIKDRQRTEYVPEPEPEKTFAHVNKNAGTENGKIKNTSRTGKLRTQIDLPVDDPIGPEELPPIEKKENFFNRTPRVKTPDQVVLDNGDGIINETADLEKSVDRAEDRGGFAQSINQADISLSINDDTEAFKEKTESEIEHLDVYKRQQN